MALHNRKLRIVFDSLPEEEHLDFIGLFNFTIRAMQFSYDAINITTTDTSKLLPDGTWTGYIGMLNRSEVDFIPAPFVVTEERWDAVAFNYPYSSDVITFVTRKPIYTPKIVALFQTLTMSVWLSLLVSTILTTLVCFMTLKYRYQLDDVILHVLAIGLNQNGNIFPITAGESMLLSTWLFAMSLLTYCFRQVLLSFLTFPPLTGVRNIPELAAAIRAGKYSAMTNEDSYLPMYLQRSQNKDIRLIGENLLNTPPGYIDDILNNSLNNLNVAHVNQRAYLSFAEEKLFVSKDSIGTYLQATAVSRDFCCKEEMDMIVHRFLAAGIDQKIHSFLDFQMAFAYFSELHDDEEERQITIIDVAGAFIILAVGWFLSACKLIIELKTAKRITR